MYVIGTCKSPGDILVSCDRHLNMQRTSHIIHSRHYCTVEKLVARVRNVNMQEISQGSEEEKVQTVKNLYFSLNLSSMIYCRTSRLHFSALLVDEPAAGLLPRSPVHWSQHAIYINTSHLSD